jgi:methyl-accepting chemotaxis protein
MFNNKLKAQLQDCQTQLVELQGFVDAVKGGVATLSLHRTAVFWRLMSHF